MTDTPAAPANTPERIAKVIARSGVASRRDVEKMILAGRVTVNGKKIDSPALDVRPADRIVVDGKPLDAPQETRVWLYYKPLGLVSTEKDEQGRRTIFDEMPEGMPRVMNVGRLDLNSEGLLLLTNDGGLKRRLELPETGWLRKYRVRVNGRPDNSTFDPLRRGITIDGEDFQPMEIELDRQQGANAWLTVGIREGKNREIRRAMAEVKLQVNRLIRVSYGPFRLNEMNPGDVVEIKRKVLREQLGDRLLLGVEEGRKSKTEREEAAMAAREARFAGREGGREGGRDGGRGGADSRGRDDRGRDDRGPRKSFEKKPFARSAQGEDGPRKPRAVGAAPRDGGGPRKDFDKKPYEKKPYARSAQGEDRPRTPRGDWAPRPGGDKPARPGGDWAGRPAGDGDRKPRFAKDGAKPGPRAAGFKSHRDDERSEGKRPYTPRGERPEGGRPETGRKFEARSHEGGKPAPRSYGDAPSGERPAPRGGKPGGFARDGKPGGFSRDGKPGGAPRDGKPGGFSRDGKPGGFARDGKPGGFKAGGDKPGGFKSHGAKSHGGGGKPRAQGFKSHGAEGAARGPRPMGGKPGGKPRG